MRIQWFPGHMHKAQKEIREVLSGIDVVIEILDARIPYSSQNPLLAGIRGRKPCIKVMNKFDLADPELSKIWHSELSDEGTRVIVSGLSGPSETLDIPDLCTVLTPTIRQTRPVHALVVGIPNVGKSTIINQLAGRKIAHTGNEPAITKSQQRVDIGRGVVLRDTPGVLWPNLENQHSGYRLAATGAIKDTAMDSADVAMYTLEYLARQYPDRLIDRYEIVDIPDIVTADTSLELLEKVGEMRGCIGRGGLVDLDRAGRIVLGDLRSGALGLVTLESPDMMIAELRLVEAERKEKEERQKQKAQDKKKRKAARNR